MLMASVIILSPVFLTIWSIRSNIFSLICLFLVWVSKNFRSSRKSLFIVSVLLLLTFFNVFYWGQATFKAGVYLYTSLFVVFLLTSEDLYKFTNSLTTLLLFLLVGGLIGFVYAYYGGGALFTFPNEDTRLNSFYLSTLSTHYVDGLIRPSGIFDEPGALSFIVCICVALRESLGMDRRQSWVMMLLGLITLSTAHAVFIALFWMKVKWISPQDILKSIVVIFLILLLLTSFDNPVNTIVTYILGRFEIVNGAFHGDNRSALIINSYNYLDLRTFLFGLDGNCIMGSPLCPTKLYTGYCCNPLTLIVHYGIFLSLPYYSAIAYLAFKFVQRKDLIILGVLLLLLQRPYTHAFGYATLLVTYLYSINYRKNTLGWANTKNRVSNLVKLSKKKVS
jgi:hypothetical protein